MASIINNSALGKIGDLLFVRQTPALNAETHKGIVTRFSEWRQRRKAELELSRLSDRELADIGLTRQQIPGVVNRVHR
jgi:uncharacterized protein YjiS (DUF1127 family)